MMMAKMKKGSKDRADHVKSADAVSAEAAATVQLTETPMCKTESLDGQTQPVDEFDMGIRELAYFKWEAAGFPEGDGFDFWLEAEREIRANRTNFNGTAE
jgi:hypothetical protein